MELNTKVLKAEGGDRFSDLPDPIRGYILSILPTRDAVATSILSSSWKNLFPHELHPLNLDLSDSQSRSGDFMKFLDSLFTKTLDSVPVLNMNLECTKASYGDDMIISWISNALEHGVENLRLNCSLDNSSKLFHSLTHGGASLTRLELGKLTMLYVRGDFELPNLTYLRVSDSVLGGKENSINTFISGCPVLKYLTLCDCNTSDLVFLIIDSPELETLSIEEYYDESMDEFHLYAPNLKVFYYDIRNTDVIYTISALESLSAAVLDIGEFGDTVYDYEVDGVDVDSIVSACSSTTRLYITGSSLLGTIMKLPIFKNLIWFRLGWLVAKGWEFLARMLQNAPNLQRLTIEKVVDKDSGEGYEKFESLARFPPICLELKMKEIEFMTFDGGDGEMKLIEYLLTNRNVLQQLKLHSHASKDTNSVLLKLLSLPNVRFPKITFEPRLSRAEMEKVKFNFVLP